MLMLWKKGFGTVLDKRNLKRQPARCSLILDSMLYWMGRNAINDIIRIIDRIGIWTDKSTLSILNFSKFDIINIYVRIFLFLKCHIEVLRGKGWCMNLLSNGSKKIHKNVCGGGDNESKGSKMLKLGESE